MTVTELAKKLRAMRSYGAKTGRNTDVMTRLFGVIFAEEIERLEDSGRNAVADEYQKLKRSAADPGAWPGSTNSAVIGDGIKLSAYVDPHDDMVRQWR